VTGIGKTLADGHSHEAEWSPAALDRCRGQVMTVARRVGRRPDVEALVQHVEITDNRRRTAEKLADLITGASADDLLDAPFMWIGTPDQIATQVLESERRWGINRYVIRDRFIGAVGPVLDLLECSR
jgi:hypothetical protein